MREKEGLCDRASDDNASVTFTSKRVLSCNNRSSRDGAVAVMKESRLMDGIIIVRVKVPLPSTPSNSWRNMNDISSR